MKLELSAVQTLQLYELLSNPSSFPLSQGLDDLYEQLRSAIIASLNVSYETKTTSEAVESSDLWFANQTAKVDKLKKQNDELRGDPFEANLGTEDKDFVYPKQHVPRHKRNRHHR